MDANPQVRGPVPVSAQGKRVLTDRPRTCSGTQGRLSDVRAFVGLARACHPEPTVAVTALAAALTSAVDGPTLTVAAAVLAGQMSVGWSNDWIDADRDRTAGRTDKPIPAGLSAALVRTAAFSALAACVGLSALMGLAAGSAHLAAVAGAWLYNLGLKSTVWSFVPYAGSFGLLPSVITLAGPGHLAPAWATAAGALLGVGAHGANVLPDLAADALTGVRGLPQRLGRIPTTVLSGAALLGATQLLARGSERLWLGIASLTVFGLGLTRPRTAFLSVLAVAALDVGLLLAHSDRLKA